jgi:hypothetical protein
MKNIISTIVILFVIIIWLFPIIISFIICNFWLIFLYFVWWIPAIFLTKFLLIIFESIWDGE